MAKRMLVDATHTEETRVAIVDGHRLEDLDFEVANRKMLKGNIYLAKVIRIEPSLQAAFVEYGGNRHGFLAFSEIHPDYYRIPVGDRPEDAHPDDDADLANAPIITEGPGKLFTAEEGDEAPQTVAITPPVRSSWADEPGSGTVSDLIPGFSFDSNESLIRDFSHPPAIEVPTGEMPPAPTETANGLALPPVEAAPVDMVGGEAADHAPERFVRPRRPNYKIQEVIKRRQVMLIQVVKEERGNKGAALTTYLSLAGRYCVLMPNTAHGGGVSRKITSHQDRRRMKEILDQLDVPEGMALILRTAGMEQDIADIKRDLDYLLRLWNNIREQTLQSAAPALIYEEADLIKRALRDLYSRQISEILVAGRTGFDRARDFMQMLIPDAVSQIKPYEESSIPLFFRYQVEEQVDALHSPIVQLPSGGYLVINPTEALVAIDVNSGRATRERHIEETALKTNLEAAEEIGRQLRLRDLAGLVVIDFIDMEDGRNNAAVERRLRDAMRHDRARLQIGRISHFGLLELSRQRLRPSLLETNFEKCTHCTGMGLVRSTESTALSVLRGLEQEGIKSRGGDYLVKLSAKVALYILNHKRTTLMDIQQRYGVVAQFDDTTSNVAGEFTIERLKSRSMRDQGDAPAVNLDEIMAGDMARPDMAAPIAEEGQRRDRGDRNERFQRRPNNRPPRPQRDFLPPPARTTDATDGNDEPVSDEQDRPSNGHHGMVRAESDQRPRRRGRRGGRRRGRNDGERGDQRHDNQNNGTATPEFAAESSPSTVISAQIQPPPRIEIPRSIHELDTTPRADDTPRSFAPYEINQAPDKPKAGWWRRLTGQE